MAIEFLNEDAVLEFHVAAAEFTTGANKLHVLSALALGALGGWFAGRSLLRK